jgi:hypothetical protein
VPPPYALPPQLPQPPQSAQQQPQTQQFTAVSLTPPPKKTNIKLIGIVAGGVVLLLLAGFAVWQFAFNGGGSASNMVSLTNAQFSYLAEESLPAETDAHYEVYKDLPDTSALLQQLFTNTEAEDLQKHAQLFADSQSLTLTLFDNAINAEKLRLAFVDYLQSHPGSLVTLDDTINSVRVWSSTVSSGETGSVLVYGNVVAIHVDTFNDLQEWKDYWPVSFKKAVDAAATTPAFGSTIAPAPNIETPTTVPSPSTVPPRSLAPAPNPGSTPPVSGSTKFTGTADFPQCDTLTVSFILNEDRTSISQLKIEVTGLANSDITKVNQYSDGSYDVGDDGQLKVSIENSKLDLVINGDTAVGTVTFVFDMKAVGSTNDLHLDFGSKPITLTAS